MLCSFRTLGNPQYIGNQHQHYISSRSSSKSWSPSTPRDHPGIRLTLQLPAPDQDWVCCWIWHQAHWSHKWPLREVEVLCAGRINRREIGFIPALDSSHTALGSWQALIRSLRSEALRVSERLNWDASWKIFVCYIYLWFTSFFILCMSYLLDVLPNRIVSEPVFKLMSS